MGRWNGRWGWRKLLGIAVSMGVFWAPPGAAMAFDPVTEDPPRRAPGPSLESAAIPSGGAAINAVFYLPGGETPAPVVVLLHGLPGEERNQDLAQVLRRAGYAVLLPHYRGAWGSAGIFSFRHCLEDIDAMLRWLDDPGVRRRFSLDAQPRALVGHSMGGYLALRAGAGHPRVSTLVNLAGPDFGLMAEALAADEASARATAERFESWVAGPLSGTSGAALVAELTEAPAFFSLAARAGHVVGQRVTLVAGSEDAYVSPARLEALQASLVAAHSPVALEVLPGDHAFSGVRLALARVVLSALGEAGP
ncbi:MAG: alpha/beta fold hydrolase [Pseudomonadota bacterium]|nr:alpha/beta fold hydrolase [Pseudomonadota bacterium]